MPTRRTALHLVALVTALCALLLGVAGVFSGGAGQMHPNAGVWLHVLAGLLGLVAVGLRLPSLYLTVLGWCLLVGGGRGLLWGEAPTSLSALTLGLVLLALVYLLPEVLPPDRLEEPADLKVVRVRGVDIAYRDLGAGPPVVLLHGYPENHRTWRHQVDWLSRDHRVVAPDWPGWGRSAGDLRRAPEYEAEVELLGAFLDALDLQRIRLIAHDYGGLIGLGYVERHPERVERFVLLNSRAQGFFAQPYALATQIAGRLARVPVLRALTVLLPVGDVHRGGLIAYARRGSFDAAVIDDYLAHLDAAAGRRWLAHLFAHYPIEPIPRLRSGLSGLDVPTLVVWGDRDPWCPLAIGVEIADRVPGATLEVVRGASHFVHEERPAEVRAALEPFLR